MADKKFSSEELILIQNLIRAQGSSPNRNVSVMKDRSEEWTNREGHTGRYSIAERDLSKETRTGIYNALRAKRRRLGQMDKVLEKTRETGTDCAVGERFRAMLISDMATLESLLPRL